MTQDANSKIKSHPLVDTTEPNLVEGTFPHSLPPLIHFEGPVIENIDGQPVEFDLLGVKDRDIHITDTTFRDGQQARPPYTVKQIVDLYELESKLDGGAGLIRESEFFIYSKKDRQAVEKCLGLDREYPKVTGWIRAARGDFKLVKEMNLAETGILTSCSDYHIFLKLKKTRKQAMEQYLEVVRAAMDEGIRPRCHMEDITRADFYGFVVPFAIELMKLRSAFGTDIKIRLCDTMGYGVPWAQAKLPRSVPKLVRGMIEDAGVPGELLEWHGHNDFHKVLANPVTAWLYGCAGCNASLLGIGERTGNTPLEAMVIEAAQLSGMHPKVCYPVITEIARYFTNEIGYEIPHNYPLVGRDFNTTRAGIHADGLLKSKEIYSCFDTMKILNRPVGVAITDKSGAAGIKHWIEINYDLNVAKDNPRLSAIRSRVDKEYEEGRTTAISDEEIHAWYKKAFEK